MEYQEYLNSYSEIVGFIEFVGVKNVKKRRKECLCS